MDIAPVTVSHELTLELIDANGQATPLEAELRYESADPYAIAACFDTGEARVRWVFARELLASGAYEPTGDGDVHVWPCLDSEGHAVVIIELCSPDGEALVQAKTNDLSVFVERMNKAVELGNESAHVDVDATIAAIFANEAA